MTYLLEYSTNFPIIGDTNQNTKAEMQDGNVYDQTLIFRHGPPVRPPASPSQFNSRFLQGIKEGLRTAKRD